MQGQTGGQALASVLEILVVVVIVAAVAVSVWLVRRYNKAVGSGREQNDWLSAHSIVVGILETESTPLTRAALAHASKEPTEATARELRMALGAIQVTVNTHAIDEPELAAAVLSALESHT